MASDIYASNFEQLLRWIFDKPAHVKPPIGKSPAFLHDEGEPKGLQASFLARRAIAQVKASSNSADAALEEYLDRLAEGLEAYRVEGRGKPEFDQTILASIESFKHHRNEFVSVLMAIAKYERGDEYVRKLHRFFEKVAVYRSRPEHVTTWSEWDFDNFKFIIQELFLYTIAIYAKQERFESVSYLLTNKYYIMDDASDPMKSFSEFRSFLPSLFERGRRNSRISLVADLLEERSKGTGVQFRDVMQADLILYLRSILDKAPEAFFHWFPDTLLYSTFSSSRYPFEVFARARSAKYLAKMGTMLGIKQREELEPFFNSVREGRIDVPRWEYHRVDLLHLMAADSLGTEA